MPLDPEEERQRTAAMRYMAFLANLDHARDLIQRAYTAMEPTVPLEPITPQDDAMARKLWHIAAI